MKRIELEKNRLDLSYQRNLQLLNITLLVGAGSFITYLVSLVLDISKAFQYTTILIILGAVTIILYRNINDTLRKISNEINDLAKN